MLTDNTYVFLSHSHYDFDKVCRLRNLLEAEGFKPLMFFLKAFENPKFEPMLKPILKEEIDKRERFILCRSENSRKSEWVRFEEEYVKSKNIPYEVIDLDADENVQLEAIQFYRRRVSDLVYISYPRSQSPFARGLSHKLQVEGFTTWFDYSSLIDNKFQELTFKAIDKAAEDFVKYISE